MSGIHLPLPPTDGGNGTSATAPTTPDGSPPATSPGIAPVGPTAPMPSGRGVLITLIALVAGLLLVLVSTLWGTAQLRQQADRLATELERFTGAAAPSQVLPPEEVYGYPDEEFEDDFPFDAEPEQLFLETHREQRTVAAGARYGFDARAGDLLNVTVASERETDFAVLELTDGRGNYLAFAERGGGRFGPAAAASSGPLELWHRFDSDDAYTLTYHSELLWGEDDIAEVLTAELHDGSGAQRVTDVDAEYPTDGSLPTYGFDAREGQVAVVTMRSRSPEVLDPLIRVYGPDGRLIGMDADGGGWPDARLTVRLPRDGRYEVEADTFLGQPPRGSRAHGYTLTVELIEVS